MSFLISFLSKIPSGKFLPLTPFRYWVTAAGVTSIFFAAFMGFNPWSSIRLRATSTLKEGRIIFTISKQGGFKFSHC